MLKKIVGLLTMMLVFVTLVKAQVTTSSMSGTVRSDKGDALTGATVTATHLPTGTVYRVATRTGGKYNIFNMNPGGPYKVVVSFVGFVNATKEDIFLTLGENSTEEFTISDKAAATLTEVVVAGRRAASTGKGGTETAIGRDKVANLPSVGRNLSDLLRFTPQVKVTALGGFSFAGQNNRYNSFMIDGAVNNDVFGLSDQGTNGGRAGAPPISLDAIDQLVVQLSPFDVSLGNFTGGGINAITRSGTNTTTGSLYWVYRNQNFAGRAPLATIKPGSSNIYERAKLSNFENKTFGFRIGGALVKNKLFYFLSVERQDDVRPQPFDPATYRGNYLANDSLTVLRNFLKSNYNYETGDFINNPDLIKADRIATRIDWNINEKNQLSASYRYTKLERVNPPRSAIGAINFVNSAEYFPSTTHSGNIELNTKISETVNNKARLTLTNVVDDRNPTGSAFPFVTIRDGGTANVINFGTEAASSANLLKQSIFNFYDAFKVVKGNNTLTFGADIDMNQTYNLFINRNYGAYEYTQMADFILGRNPIRYRRGYSLVDGNAQGDNAVNSAAQFKTIRVGLFVGDDIRVNDDFTLTVGVRADKTEFLNAPKEDAFFRDSGRAVISQFYDLKNATSGKLFKPTWLLSPRIGFKYNMRDENITIRGGIGLFAGRMPLVWPGGTFQNTGVTIGGIDQQTALKPFRADVNNQYTAADFGFTDPKPSGEMNLVAKDFKLPQVLRTSLAMDKRLGNGWTFTVEGVFTKNINEVDWKNVNLNPTSQVLTTGVGARTVYNPALISNNGLRIPLRPQLAQALRNPYTSIILIQNSDGKRGFSYNFTATIDKAWRNGWSFNANYAYGNSMVRNEATSSINSSNWNNMEAVNGRNAIGLTTSDFDLGHRITTYIARKISYLNKRLATTISFDYTGQSGSPISYTMTGNINGDGNNFNDLMYVPTKAEVGQMVFVSNTVGGVTYTPAQQIALFDAYIDNDRYLNRTRGRFAERNGARLPFSHIVNAKVQQDFNLRISKKTYTFQVVYDIFNLTNMINQKWGRQYFANFDQVQVLQFAGFQTGTLIPTYRYIIPTTPYGKPYSISDGLNTFNSSRWSSQLTLRFNF